MANPNIHERSFDLRYEEMDRHGEATPTAVLSLLEETAFSHCEASGWGIFRLLDEGFGWVLLRGALEMRRYPAYREPFAIQTWLSSARRFFGEREFRIVTPEGELLGSSTSLWAFVNLGTKRLAPVPEGIVKAWAPGGGVAANLTLGEVDFPEPEGIPSDALRERVFHVRAAEIDTNGHVNNVNYFSWALEALAGEVGDDRVLASIVGQYKREVTYGAAVRTVALPEGEGYRHGAFATPVGGDPSYLAAAAVTTWRARDAASAPGRTGQGRPAGRVRAA